MKGSSILNAVYAGFLRAVTAISPALSTRIRFRVSKGYSLNMDRPQSFDEKISWLKVNVYNRSALVKQCADKLQVRSYVSEMGAENILNPLYHVYSSVADVDWDDLPGQFVLKWSTGAGGVVVCPEKSQFERDFAVRTLEQKAAHDSSSYSAELQYQSSPARLLCERYISSDSGVTPTDYKFYCYEGEPKYVLVCANRGSGVPTFSFYDMEWHRVVGFRKKGHEAAPSDVLSVPDGFEDAKIYARKLANPFPFVRVDLYLEHGNVFFGELTFTPCGGVNSNLTRFGDAKLGEPLKWLFDTRGDDL